MGGAYFLNYCDRQAVFSMFPVLSLIIWSMVTVATGFATAAWNMLALRGAMGVSESLFMPTAIALTASAFSPALRSRAIAVLTTAQIAGTVVGTQFGGWMADRGQWRGAFYVLGAAGLMYAIPCFMFLRRFDDRSSKRSQNENGGLWKSLLGIDRLLSLTVAAYLAAGDLLIAGIYVFFPKDFRTTQ